MSTNKEAHVAGVNKAISSFKSKSQQRTFEQTQGLFEKQNTKFPNYYSFQSSLPKIYQMKKLHQDSYLNNIHELRLIT